jgi:hypothetical protein
MGQVASAVSAVASAIVTGLEAVRSIVNFFFPSPPAEAVPPPVVYNQSPQKVDSIRANMGYAPMGTGYYYGGVVVVVVVTAVAVPLLLRSAKVCQS